jgi:hypothetical protein
VANVEELVENARKPGTFNIMNAIKDRAYPKDEIVVFLDEDLAFRASELDDAINKISEEIGKKKDLNKKALDLILARRDEILDRKEKLLEEMGGAKYVFHITGISEGKRSDLFNLAVEKFPVEQEKNRNPFSGQLEKSEIESRERDNYFTALLWEAYITKIVAPDGEEQESISFEDAVELRRSLPIAGTSQITDAIEKVRAASALFMMAASEDFLAKS